MRISDWSSDVCSSDLRLPRGTSDVQGLSDVNMYQQYHLGITDAIDYSKLKNAKYLIPSMKFEYGIGHIYSGKVGVYNPKIVPTAPASYKQVFDPDHGRTLGIIDIQYQYTLVTAPPPPPSQVHHLDTGK